MKKTTIIAFLILFALSSCIPGMKKDQEQMAILSALYNDSKIESQRYKINPEKDTTIVTPNGTTFRIYANSFVTDDDSKITGPIELLIKEAYAPIDFVLGNLTTVSDDKFLVSGGMIHIGAKAGNKDLKLGEGKEIGCIVPTGKLDKNMEIYSGERDDNGSMNWTAPEPVLNEKLKTLERSFITITYQYRGDLDTLNPKIETWLWDSERKEGDKLKLDSVELNIVQITKDLVSLRQSDNGLFIPDVISKKGRNGYVEDYNTSYIFSINKLGWANIDKLYDDPKAEEVKMLATISNQDEFGHVFTSLLLPEQKMYLPGYQKGDNSFGFTHNDEEQLILPVGSEAIIIATAYRNDKPYFSLKKITIERDMNMTFTLTETTPEGLKTALKEGI
jgi:hypothetical protein